MEDFKQNQLADEFAERYMVPLFYFCLKKTGDSHEAEDLTQDIALQVLTALQNGTRPQHFSAWVWQIARNRYCLWANRKHKRAEYETGDSLDAYEIEDEGQRPDEQIIRTEELRLLRRELAFIRGDYRDIMVAHYIDGKSLREIAAELSLPESAVKQRLYRARILLKEGMDMAREFGVRSYKPEHIGFTNICDRLGDRGQPHTLVEPKLNQNIFATAYGTPQSAEELAIEMGVSLVYMEDTLERLRMETLLIKKNGKYETAFPIISREAQLEIHETFAALMARILPPLEEGIDRLMEQYREAGASCYGPYQDYEDAKWVILMRCYEGLYDVCPNTPKYRLGTTERPDHGAWDEIGFEMLDGASKIVGCHHQHNGFICYRYAYAGIWGKTPDFLNRDETATLRSVVEGKSDLNESVAQRLISYGYLRKEADGYVPTIAVFREAEAKKLVKYGNRRKKQSEIFWEHAKVRGELNHKVLSLMTDMNLTIREIVRKDLPPSMRDNKKLVDGVVYSLCRNSPALGFVVEQAIADGWLAYNDRTSVAIGAFIDLP